MDTTEPILESRPAGRVWIVPLILVGMTAALAVAWAFLNLVGGVEGMEIAGPVFLLGGIFSLGLAGLFAWGIQRARLVITNDELTLLLVLGRIQTLSLPRLATVRIGQTRSNPSVPTLDLTDADGGSVWIGSKGWEREAEILQLIGDAAQRSGASVTPDAQAAIARGAIGTPD